MKETVDWGAVRIQAAIAAMQNLLGVHCLNSNMFYEDSPKEVAEKSVEYADALIVELKKGEL